VEKAKEEVEGGDDLEYELEVSFYVSLTLFLSFAFILVIVCSYSI